MVKGIFYKMSKLFLIFNFSCFPFENLHFFFINMSVYRCLKDLYNRLEFELINSLTRSTLFVEVTQPVNIQVELDLVIMLYSCIFNFYLNLN